MSEVAERPAASRVDAFAALARARAAGEIVSLPRQFTGRDRRIHVRQTIREDHETRIAQGSRETPAKFDKLASSLFSFFRGTALLFYRDMPGEDSWLPTVLAPGDIHPENFGLLPDRDHRPIFGITDFDEAYYAPFTWDLKRGATAFMIASEESGGYGPQQRWAVADSLVRGYLAAMAAIADNGDPVGQEIREEGAPPMIAELIRGSGRDRDEWLATVYQNGDRSGFGERDDLVPRPDRREEFQDVVDRWVRENDIDVPDRAAQMRVKDVAVRLGSGTQSLGLARYSVLLEGPTTDGTDDLVLEFKQARESAMSGLVPPSDVGIDGAGDRVAHAERVQLIHGDRFHGQVTFEGTSFMTRERAPFTGEIDLEALTFEGWRDYAEICGATLAHAHALSDQAEEVDHAIEPEIVDAVGSTELFVDDVVAFAEEAADRVRRDHEMFRADHALGAFDRIDRVYR